MSFSEASPAAKLFFIKEEKQLLVANYQRGCTFGSPTTCTEHIMSGKNHCWTSDKCLNVVCLKKTNVPLQQPGIHSVESFLCNPSFTFPLILDHLRCNTDPKNNCSSGFLQLHLSRVHWREKTVAEPESKGLQCTNLWNTNSSPLLSADERYVVSKLVFSHEIIRCIWLINQQKAKLTI